ncbi:aldo/keto reductase [Tunturibacter empetritectus]|uniref:Diketogulonate reductase-like aldo/keto reductase n=1 Tax=Tunturiibacter lichenicola TaxID=2051959 RepID=A0A7W8JB38_9BACT|nr:aldo/keto reductase [Edaphobacter lichenicola]MBB5346027.1 diketogulonate reductase-like aldo/keto reductase [Edaphobacter lichenicola]
MEQIALGDTGCTTTRLGFGCSSLMGAMGRRASLDLLESAYDAGIRHFDVAPMYGYGEAEGCLREFLQRHRDHVTVTTKYGIPPAKKSPLISLARHIARPILKAVPSAKHRLAQAASAATRTSERATFTPQQAKASLERSLAALHTDHIDLWLLHEATAADLRDEALLSLLEEKVQQGTIGSFGIGSSADKIPSLLAEHPAYCRTLQYEWSVLNPEVDPQAVPPPPSPFRIHHRALTENFRSLHRTLSQNKQLCQRWSASTNTDLSNPDHLAHLMLKAALVMNPKSIILFSSKNPLHIQANAKTAEDPTLEAPAREFHRLVQTERNQL